MEYIGQIAALASKSEYATQTFVYTCDGTTGWFDQSDGSTKNAIILLGANENVFFTKDLEEMLILQDGCKVRIVYLSLPNFGQV